MTYRECRNISGKDVCSISEEAIDRIDKVEQICSKSEFTARELFNALDADGDGVITKKDLKILASSDLEKKYISRKDLKNLYSGIGKKVCQGICNIMDNSNNDEYITIDDLMEVLDRDKDGKVRFGEILRIANKDGNLLFITSEEFESEFDGKWKSDK